MLILLVPLFLLQVYFFLLPTVITYLLIPHLFEFLCQLILYTITKKKTNNKLYTNKTKFNRDFTNEHRIIIGPRAIPYFPESVNFSTKHYFLCLQYQTLCCRNSNYSATLQDSTVYTKHSAYYYSLHPRKLKIHPP